MNEVLKCIYERKSVRNYQDKPVPDEIVNELLRAAIQAPTGMNEQPWGFIVIRDKTLMKGISDFSKKRLRFVLLLDKFLRLHDPEKTNRLINKISAEKLNIFYNSPLLILLCTRKKAYSKICDGAAAAENLLLAAHSLGLGGCWVGLAKPINRDKKWRRRLGIPDNFTLIASLIVGYPDDQSEKKKRGEPLVFKTITQFVK